jgi:hypothetical protein
MLCYYRNAVQMRLNVEKLKGLAAPCRIESLLLFWGQAGALAPSELLHIVSQVSIRFTSISIISASVITISASVSLVLSQRYNSELLHIVAQGRASTYKH